MYLYELPTTGAVSFADFCIDVVGAYTVKIAEATETRANLRGLLKESKRIDDSEKDYLRLIKVLDEYLPRLCGIMSCVAEGEISLRSEPVFSWRTTLSANLFHSSPRLQLPTLHADLASCLLTYGFALSNLATAAVIYLGSFERERGISDIERKAKDEKLNFAVTLLCRASGIFSYISSTVLFEWDRDGVRDPGGAKGVNRPPDLSREVNAALAKMSLADAQTLAIRKLLSKSAYDSTITPGPPLPRSHPSPALIAKLHLECSALYSSARALAKTPGSSSTKKDASSGSSLDGDITSDLRRHLSDETAFHAALSRKWLGVEAGENGGNDKGGEAVGFLGWAKKDLEELAKTRLGDMGKDKEKKGARKGKVADELEIVNVFYKHYRKTNDSLSFQSVPKQTDLQALIPAGRLAVAARAYTPPTPSFGPKSIEYIRSKAEELELSREEEAADGDSGSTTTAKSPSPSGTSQSGGTYAGAGSYF